MSTPLPPGSKLEGPEAYAPRRIRTPPSAPEGDPPAAPPVVPEQVVPDQQQVKEESEIRARQAAHASLKDEIKAALDLQLYSGDCRLPPATNLPPLRDGGVGVPSSATLLRFPWEAARSPRSPLEPERVPEPVDAHRREGIVPLALRIAIAFGVAAMVAFVITTISSTQRPGHPVNRLSDRMAAAAGPAPTSVIRPEVPPRILVKNETAVADQPLSLDAIVEPATGHESLVLAGLEVGTRLSAGTPAGESRWRLGPTDLGRVYVYAPPGFVGVMNTAFDLLSRQNRLMDSRNVQLKWIPATAPMPRSSDGANLEHPHANAVSALDPAEAEHLMNQGKELLKLGDIATSRLAFQRLAQAGNAEAAFALAETYDPGYLSQHDVIGITGDEAKAREWYQRAKELQTAQAHHVPAVTAGQ